MLLVKHYIIGLHITSEYWINNYFEEKRIVCVFNENDHGDSVDSIEFVCDLGCEYRPWTIRTDRAMQISMPSTIQCGWYMRCTL